MCIYLVICARMIGWVGGEWEYASVGVRAGVCVRTYVRVCAYVRACVCFCAHKYYLRIRNMRYLGYSSAQDKHVFAERIFFTKT